ncbi:MAG: hypothetical protein ACLUEK_05210 [Oscillospiraceae bacterium]
MHELSIVTYVIKQVDAIARQNELTQISSVTLRVRGSPASSRAT